MSHIKGNQACIKTRIRKLVQQNAWLRPVATFTLSVIYTTKTLWSRLSRQAVVARYLREHEKRGLHLGCGANLHEGWLNTDLVISLPGAMYLDAAKQFPLPNESMDQVFSEHMIEHINHPEALFMLRECFRVLKPGGRIRIATPNLDVVLKLYAPEASQDVEEYMQWFNERNMKGFGGTGPAAVINCFFYSWGHRFIYDRVNLESSFREAGFTDLEWCAVGQSAKPELRNLERHGAALGSERWNAFETMILEGRKP